MQTAARAPPGGPKAARARHPEGKAGQNMTIEKRTWRKPELTVLVRGKPEEAVLVACKANAAANAGPGSDRNYCYAYQCQPVDCVQFVSS